MYKLLPKRLFPVFLIAIALFSAQKKDITLEKINGSAFYTEYLRALLSLNSGKECSLHNYDRKANASTIDAYNYESGEILRTIVNSKDLEGIGYMTFYQFNEDETKLLLAAKLEQFYMRIVRRTYGSFGRNKKLITFSKLLT